MSDANRAALRYIQEVTWGEVPAGPPKFTNLRFVSEGLKGTKQTEVSEEIRDDRQISDIIRTGIAAEGDINFELSMETYGDFILAVLMAASWSAPVIVATAAQVDVTAATGTFTHATSWDNAPTVGQWVRVSGFTGIYAVNNGFFKVASSAAGVFTVSNKDNLIDASSQTGISIKQGSQAVNGVAEKSFSIEKEFTDLSNVFLLYRGLMVQSLSLDLPVDGRITGAFSFIGRDEQDKTVTQGDGSPTVANTNPIVSSSNDIQFINIDHGSVCLISGSVEIVNNLREIRCAGTLGLNSVGVGRFGVTGDFELLFTSLAQKIKYLAHSTSGFAVAIEDGETGGALGLGNGMILEIPSYKSSDDETVAGGVDTEVVEAISFEAFMDATEGITARFVSFDAE